MMIFLSFCSPRVIENGVETITVIEDGELKSRTINGVPQPIGGVGHLTKC